MIETARIITSYGRRYIVRTPAGQLYDATTRKKCVDFACGDWVDMVVQNAKQAVIEDFQPRKSLLYRQDAWKTKLIAANVERLFIVLAAVPSPSEILLQRALLAAEAGEIEPFIVLNKTDLAETALWRERLAFYQDLGYPLIEVSGVDRSCEIPIISSLRFFSYFSCIFFASLSCILILSNSRQVSPISFFISVEIA